MTQKFREESDSLGIVKVPTERLWGAQTQRSLEYFSIGDDLIPSEMIKAYAIVKKASAITNCKSGNLDSTKEKLIIQTCDELLEGKHQEEFPLHVWMTGSGTQFNMNVNEVISNRCSQIAGKAIGSKSPVHPNDHVNMSQSSNDSFPTAMNIAAALGMANQLLPSVKSLRDSLNEKVKEWQGIIKIGRTHMQDATPLTLGQEISGYVGMLDDNISRLEESLKGTLRLALGGTAVGTGLNTEKGFAENVAKQIAVLSDLEFISAPNKFTVQGSHDDLVWMSSSLKTLAVSLFKISNDIRLLSCGPRAGLYELIIPSNEPGSSIMPGKVNPTQCEAMSMISVQVIANDNAVAIGGGSGHLEMNVYKPLLIFNISKSIRILSDGCNNFRKYLVDGMKPNEKQIKKFLERSLMLVTALSPIIGYDKASAVAHHAIDNDTTLKESALQLGVVTAEEFDRIVDPSEMLNPNIEKNLQ